MRLFSLTLLFATAAGAAPTVILRDPQLSAVGDSVTVNVTVQSQYLINSVKAQAGNSSVNLGGSGGSYSGTLNLASEPMGPLTLTVTATDAASQTGSVQKSLVHSTIPVLDVAQPLDFTVARPQLPVQATCPTAYGCTGIEVRSGSRTGALIASADGGSFNQSLSLAQSEGAAVALYVVALDSSGPMDERVLTAYVDSSPTLVEVERAQGPILDVTSTRLLFSGDGGLRIRNLGTTNEVAISGPVAVNRGFLTNVGAIWPGGEWANGQTLNTPALGNVIARGNIASWTDPGDGRAFIRDVAAGSTTAFDGGVFNSADDVADNGDVLFSWLPNAGQVLSEAVIRHRAGAWNRVASDAGFRHHRGRGDGINTVFLQRSSTGTAPIYLVTASGDLSILGEYVAAYLPQPDKDYRVAGGWVAYTSGIPDGLVQVYRRDLAGAKSLVSVWTSWSYVDGLAPNGEIMLINSGQRYLAVPNQQLPQRVSSSLGRSVFLASGWHVAIGRSLFKVTFNPADGGTDAGSLDAGAAPTDAGASTDAGEEPGDAGTPSPRNEGCGYNGGGGPLAFALMALALRLRRCRSKP
jgi:hypothetical protein